PSLRQADFDVEKNVILEEIGMYDDQPTFTAYETLMQSHFRGHPLGRSVLGSTESITALTGEQMREYHGARYRAGNIVLAVAGNWGWGTIQDLAREACGAWPAGMPERMVAEAQPRGGVNVVTKESSQQQHLMHMAPAPPARHPLRYAADVLSVV